MPIGKNVRSVFVHSCRLILYMKILLCGSNWGYVFRAWLRLRTFLFSLSGGMKTHEKENFHHHRTFGSFVRRNHRFERVRGKQFTRGGENNSFLAENEIENNTAAPQTVTVTFNSNGGSEVPAQSVEKGGKAIKPQDPVKNGYNFTGWTFQGELWSFIGFNVDSDITLDANWSEPIFTLFGNTITGLTNFGKTLSEIEVPKHIDGITITGIEDSAFRDCCDLTSIAIPNSVTSIGKYAFYGCSSLTSITIPDSVTSIGFQAFYDCSSLTSITIPDSVTSIGHAMFQYCSGLTSITIPDSVTSIGDHAFDGCSELTSITIPDNVTSIGSGAFSYCKGLTSITIPNNVTSIEDHTFQGCKNLTSITIPDSVTSIGGYAFDGCSGLTSITIPDNVTSIGFGAFSYCNFDKVTIPNNVTSIEDSAFRGCKNLASITIPDSVTSIGFSAFGGCNSLTSVTFANTKGWYSCQLHNTDGGWSMTVTDANTNATYLTNYYYDYYWYRK